MVNSLKTEPSVLSALRAMPVVRELNKEYIREKPFKNHIPMLESHLTIEQAVAALVLRNGGANNVVVCSTPYGTDKEVYETLKKARIPVFAKPKGEAGISEEKCRSFIEAAFSAYEVDGIIDDGGRFPQILKNDPQLSRNVLGVVEQTRGGENCWQELFGKNLPLPVLSANSSPLKKIEHRVTAQTVVSASLTALKSQFAGKLVAVIGFGDVGREIVLLLIQQYGARVIVVDDDQNKLVEPIFLGCDIETKERALRKADVVITATGKVDIISGDDFLLLKDGCILINAGRYGEIDVKSLEKIASRKYIIRGGPESLTQYILSNHKGEKSVYVVACGFPVNIYVGSGNPKEVLDLVFGLMLECLRHVYEHHQKLKKRLMPSPKECVQKVSKIFLKVHGFPPGLKKLAGT
jgi:adenosylhomocysteinase